MLMGKRKRREMAGRDTFCDPLQNNGERRMKWDSVAIKEDEFGVQRRGVQFQSERSGDIRRFKMEKFHPTTDTFGPWSGSVHPNRGEQMYTCREG